MGLGAGLYMYDVVVKSSRSLSHLLMSSCFILQTTRMLANGQRDGRPAEHRSCPLFNAAKFG